MPTCCLDGVGGERTKNEVEIRLCVCVCGDGGCPGWVVVSHPSPRPPAACRFRFRFPGFWNPGSYVCVRAWNVQRYYPSRDSEGKRPHLRMVATLVVVCRAFPFGIYAFIWGDYPVGGSWLEGGGCHPGKYM